MKHLSSKIMGRAVTNARRRRRKEEENNVMKTKITTDWFPLSLPTSYPRTLSLDVVKMVCCGLMS